MKKCKWCGKDYNGTGKSFCSKVCEWESKKKRVQKICKYCGKIYKVPLSRLESKFCSKRCHYDSMHRYYTCQKCGGKYHLTKDWAGRKYCSKKCQKANEFNLYKTCLICGKRFKVRQKASVGKYCSDKCYRESTRKEKIKIQCLNCDKIFLEFPYRKKAKFCSQECRNQYLVGEKHWHWKGGFKYYPQEFFRIRPEIRRRDNFTCQICKRKENLVIHHRDINPLNNDPSNLITLCRQCHIGIHFHNLEVPEVLSIEIVEN